MRAHRKQQGENIWATRRRTLWFVFLTAATAFGYWALFSPWLKEVIRGRVLLIYALTQILGGFWMIYNCVRTEQRPFRFILISLIPYSFVWYYFEKVRPPRHRPLTVRPPLQTGETSVDLGNRTVISLSVRTLVWAFFLAACTSFGIWEVVGPWSPHGVALVLVILFFMAQPLGACWMVYRSSRVESRPGPFFLLAFVPYAFVWYYIERTRLNRGGRASPTATSA